MNILIIGSGGREHAFAWKLSQSPSVKHLYIAPGNAGTSDSGQNINLAVDNFDAIAQCCQEKQIDLLVVGPEAPLVGGIRDYFEQHEDLQHINIVGPGKAGAQLEGSKDFSKAFMQRHQIPTAAYRTFTQDTLAEGLAYLESHSLPIVLKADGLAAGKGVVICTDRDEALSEFKAMIEDKKFGEASTRVVVEQFLSGIELSVFVLTDGEHYKILPAAKDYKRIGEGDTGLNTGGMGAISPVPFADNAFLTKVEEQIVIPTVKGLAQEDIAYQGFLFIGLMNVAGNPYVIEYNCRMGDPETEVVLPRIQNDFAAMLMASATKELATTTLETDPRTAATVMLVSEGYPGAYEKGKAISGTDQVKNSILFHAGTKLSDDEQMVTNGGRLIAITSFGNSIKDAVEQSLTNASTIQYEGKYYRKDIGYEFLNNSGSNS